MKLAFVFCVLFIALLIPSVYALPTPQKPTFLPETISPNGSFLMYSEYGQAGSIRISWDKKYPSNCINPGVAFFGSLPKAGDMWMCYFSSTDPASTCGPSPFTGCIGGSTYQMGIMAVDKYGANATGTFQVTLGEIQLNTQLTQVNNTEIRMKVCAVGSTLKQTNGAYFEVYTDDLTLVDSGYLDYDIMTTCHLGDTSLTDPGKYYIAFEGYSDNGDAGGDLKIVTVAAEEPETPIGDGNNTPSTNVIASDVSLLSPVLGEGSTSWSYSGSRIINKGAEIFTHLTTKIPAEMQSYVNVTLHDSSIGANESVFFTVTLRNIQQSMNINTVFDLYSNDTLIAQIPLSIYVTKLGTGTCQPTTCEASDVIDITPKPFVAEKMIIGTAFERVFKITNNADEVMSAADFDYSTDGSISLVAVTLPTQDVQPGGEADVTIKLNPSIANSYKGTVTIKTTVGTKNIYIYLDFMEDMDMEIQDVEADLQTLTDEMSEMQQIQYGDLLDDISSAISAADSYKTSDISFAKKKIGEASGMISALSETYEGGASCPPCNNPAGEFDFMSLLIYGGIGIVVIIIIVFLYMFIKNRQIGGGNKGEEDEEFGQDEFDLPPEE